MTISNDPQVPQLGTPGKEYRFVHPYRLMMWLYIMATVMIFAGWTSAVLVSSADWHRTPGGWAGFALPSAFNWSTGVIIVSSVLLHIGFWAAKHSKPLISVFGILTGVGLGFVFLYGQYTGFEELINGGVYLVGERNPSGSFVYVLAFMHGVHIVAAILFGLYFLGKALFNKLKPGRLMGFELLLTFWHALGVLWVYLFVFLSYVYN
jgi:cytochrome c oxidase subunit 3